MTARTFYSASLGGFIDRALFPELPDDAVPVTQEQHQALLAGQSQAKAIVADDEGRPVLAEPPPPSAEQLADAERLWRDNRLSSVQWLRERHRDELELGRDTTLSVAQFEELLTYIQALRDWPQADAFPAFDQRPAAPGWIDQPT
ncbi:phage tail assembly chaperone [Pseudomonas sp. Marseille-P9899]|uniref:phage tail assembly chaperone n=1 Tax=Pseudomonas sp. Marseille-P9899 TaxID=2730401 RepID=UPI00158C83E9|nr:phage tail assembly chaperone [Pseudomonas sp. Marseille-P9899]